MLSTAHRDKIIQLNQDGARFFYLYDLQPMAAKIARLRNTLPDQVTIFYAMKANPHPAFLTAARQAGLAGIEIASQGEGEKALAAGFRADQIIFTGPGKSLEELRWCVQRGVRTVNIESLTEAHRLHQLCREYGRTQDILVRVNPNFDIHGAAASFSGDSSKMGIDVALFPDQLRQIRALDGLRFRGLHVYAASGVLDVDNLIRNIQEVFTIARDLEARDPDCRCDVIDFGGGFGIDYSGAAQEFSLADYTEKLQREITKFGFQDRMLVLELGRYLTADSGWYCTEINDIKISMGKPQIVCHGGTHHFRRPAAIGNHPISIIPMHRPKIFADQVSVAARTAFIGGPLCNTADRLAKGDIWIDAAEIGDIAVFALAGAYGKTMSHLDFLSHPHPPEIVMTQSAGA